MNTDELEAWGARCREFAEGVEADAAHDVAHLRRVVKSARELAAAEGGAPEVILPAAWLHDCVAVAKDSPERARASALAAERAIDFLRAASYPAEFLEGIYHAIEAHSFSGGIAPRTLEARIVQDADRLDALGAIGIARCFAVGGALGRTLYADGDPFCDERAADDSRYGVDHFFRKLFRIAATMQTASGHQEATRRGATMRAYLEAFASEIGESIKFPNA